MPANATNRWTAEQDAILRADRAAGICMRATADKIGRTYKAVRTRARDIGISRKNGSWKTPKALAFITRLAAEGLSETVIASRLEAEVGISLSRWTIAKHLPDGVVAAEPEHQPRPVKRVIDLDGIIIRKTSIAVVDTSFFNARKVQVSVPALSFMGEAA